MGPSAELAADDRRMVLQGCNAMQAHKAWASTLPSTAGFRVLVGYAVTRRLEAILKTV
jgi:hypothetical protein